LKIICKDIDNPIETRIENDNGFVFEEFWNLSKYIIENILSDENNKLLDKPVDNKIINQLLTAPILTEDGMYKYYLLYKKMNNIIILLLKFSSAVFILFGKIL
jgi:hypothetical protein